MAFYYPVKSQGRVEGEVELSVTVSYSQYPTFCLGFAWKGLVFLLVGGGHCQALTKVVLSVIAFGKS